VNLVCVCVDNNNKGTEKEETKNWTSCPLLYPYRERGEAYSVRLSKSEIYIHIYKCRN